MPRRGGQAHVATIKTKGRAGRNNVLPAAPLLPGGRQGPSREPRDLSHLLLEVIDAIRKMLSGRVLVDFDEQLEIESSLPHGHVAAVLGVLRGLDLERLLARERCRERDLCVAMICQLVIGSCSKLSMTRRLAQTTLADELPLGEVTETELLGAMDWLQDRQQRVENRLARRHLTDGAFVLYDRSLQLRGGPLLLARGARSQPRRQAGQAADQLGAGALARRPADLGATASGHRAGCDRHRPRAVRDRAGDPGR